MIIRGHVSSKAISACHPIVSFDDFPKLTPGPRHRINPSRHRLSNRIRPIRPLGPIRPISN